MDLGHDHHHPGQPGASLRLSDIGTFVADGDHGALVTTPVDVNAAFLSSGAVAIEVFPEGIRITP
jgi:hypothetical protein